MTVTMDAPIWLSDYVVQLSWSSSLTSPTYYVWIDGNYMQSTSAESMDLTVGEGEQPIIDVFDSASDDPDYVSNGRVALCWWPVSGAGAYRVEEYVSSTWTARETITDSGEGFFSWLSRVLEDVTTHQFRIVTIDAAGNDGANTTFSTVMVRQPDVPSATYTYSATTHKITAA